jgi:hypothetical protein
MPMGRGTYEVFAATLPGQAGDFADRLNSMRKYVFSSTLDRADWNNSTLINWNNSTIIRGDAAAEVARLKQQDGRDLALYDHGLLAQALQPAARQLGWSACPITTARLAGSRATFSTGWWPS